VTSGETQRTNAPDAAWSGLGIGACDADGLIRRSIDPLELMQRVADQALSMIDAADGALIGLLIDPGTLRYVCGAGRLTGFVGETLALEGSLSGRAIRTDATLLTADTEADPRVNRDATRGFDVRSSVCVPLGRGHEPVGVVNVSAARPDAFDQHDVELLRGLAAFMSTVIGAASDFLLASSRVLSARRAGADTSVHDQAPFEHGCPDADAALTGRFVAGVLDPQASRQIAARERLEALIAKRRFSFAFQPIFDLGTGSACAYEALARFGRGRANGDPPDVVLARAHRFGLGVELERLLVAGAVAHLRRLPRAATLAVNVGPGALLSEEIGAALAGAAPRRLIVELTEHVAVADYPRLVESVGRLRERGIRLAIDDAGAGFASLMHILKLAPDFIKLDRQLISGIDLDPVRQCLASSLGRFAHETGATLVAEGVETAAELAVLRDLGIDVVQGFHLARPARIGALEQVTRRGAERIRSGRPGPRLPRSRGGARGRVAAARA